MLIFACYRLLPDNGKCTNCMSHLLHGTWQSIVLVGIFVSSSSSMPICVLIRVLISLAFICFSNLCSFYNLTQFPRLVLESSTGTWTHISVMIKTCSFNNSQACKQIMCSIRFRQFSIFYVIKMHRIEV